MSKNLSPTNIFGGAIAVYENVLDNYEDHIKIANMLSDDDSLEIKFHDSTVLSWAKDESLERISEYSKVRTGSQLHVTTDYDNDELSKLHNIYSDIVFARLKSYKEKFGILEDIYNPENFQLLKYETGQYFQSHHDSIPGTNRSISILIYLNDNYEGGEIEFIYFDKKIKPKAGTLIMFPSNYPYKHVAHPVTKGTKYAVATFLHER